MKGLILKDFITIKKQLRIYTVFIIFFAFTSIFSGDTSFLGGILCLYCAMIPVNTLAYDEMVKWDKYALSMPITRRDIILSKYFIGLISISIGLLIMTVFNLFLPVKEGNSFFISLIFFGLSIVFLSILLPVIFKFGVEKGRMAMMLTLFLPAILIMVASKINLPVPNAEAIKIAAYFSPVIIILILLVSMSISLRIYTKKEL